MPKREIEGDWVMGWPDRKRASLMAGKDAEGRVINGRAPVLDLEDLITPTDAYYVVNQLEIPEPVHPDDWRLAIAGAIERPIELSLEDAVAGLVAAFEGAGDPVWVVGEAIDGSAGGLEVV